MNLALKIIGALVLVVWIALASASWLIERNTARTYRSYLDQIQVRLLNQLAAQAEIYHQAGEDWPTIQAWLDDVVGMPMSHMGPANAMPRMRNRGQMMMPNNAAPLFILIDPDDGLPLVKSGPPASAAQRAASVPVRLGSDVVALLMPVEVGTRLGQAEQTVLDQVQRAILLSAGLAGLLAVVLGGFVVWTLLRPLHALHAGVAAISLGDLNAEVPVQGNDELGRLAGAFNAMSARLRRQEALRRRLMADVAHELRTPLSVIQGNLQAMLDGVYPLSHDEIRTVHRETRLLSRLVDDLHELAQAEAGALALQRQPLAVTEALERMAALFTPIMAARGVELRIHPPTRDLIVSADPDRLQQILHNLLGNALRHTPTGGVITLGAQAHPSSQSQSVCFTVSDTGPGIAPEHLPHVFDRFYRADASRRRAGVDTGENDHTTGAGLGLAIVRALVEAHDGSIGVESSVGGGATFRVILPLDG